MKKFSAQNTWQLFLACAFPFHFWAILIALQDIEWIIKRTNVSDAVGVISYAMLFALFESIFVFVCILTIGTVLLSKIEEKKLLAMLSSLIFLLSCWAMLPQLYALNVWNTQQITLDFFQNLTNSLRGIYIIMLVLISLTMFLPVIMIYRNKKLLEIILEGFNRLSLLTMFYLVLDCFAFIVIVFRSV